MLFEFNHSGLKYFFVAFDERGWNLNYLAKILANFVFESKI